MPVPYPLSSGHRFDASSIELQINGKRYIGCAECEYEQTLDPGVVRGLAAQPLGFTRGILTCQGRVVMLREEFQDLSTDLQALAVGLLEAIFTASITYSELPPAAATAILTTSTDTIVGMRFTTTRHRFAAGSSDPIQVEMPFIARYILVNDIAPLNNLYKLAIAATAA